MKSDSDAGSAGAPAPVGPSSAAGAGGRPKTPPRLSDKKIHRLAELAIAERKRFKMLGLAPLSGGIGFIGGMMLGLQPIAAIAVAVVMTLLGLAVLGWVFRAAAKRLGHACQELGFGPQMHKRVREALILADSDDRVPGNIEERLRRRLRFSASVQSRTVMDSERHRRRWRFAARGKAAPENGHD